MHKLEASKDLDALLEDIGDRTVVMLGESTHGTHEYYIWRTAISKRLILEKGFNFIAVEGDWPDCYRINRYIKSVRDENSNFRNVLMNFNRWPTWMWANWEIAALGEWLMDHNKNLEEEKKIGFYGLDVYSLWDSMKEMMSYLEKEDPEAAQSVKKAIQCFEPWEGNENLYSRYSMGKHSCRDQVVALLKEVRMKTQILNGDREAGFNTEQNALVAVNAEKYYRAMVSFDNESWNVRDRHMMETFERLMSFHGNSAKGIIWAHNTHIGDARATDMKKAGMVNIGQLAREHYGFDQVYLVGFGTYGGSVIAGSEWGAPSQEMTVPGATEGSIEYLLYQESPDNRYLLFNTGDIRTKYVTDIMHRAIGVVYDPERERLSNYVPSAMSQRYDAFLFLANTKALHPIYLIPDSGKIPETWPFGF